MIDQPISMELPWQEGDSDVLTLRPYKGAEKLQGKVRSSPNYGFL